MIRKIGVGSLFFCLILPVGAQPAPDLDALKKYPIITGGGTPGRLLRQWWEEGTAAGNAGDFYDNRDGDHSPLNLAPWPQMSAVKYTPEEIKFKRHWAAARMIRPHVTFGNSSTSAPAHLGGSNPRSYYTTPFGLSFLYAQYTKNNLYIYPEHRDHDPGHSGNQPGGDGYGDLFPTNTPYLIISQGSSGSDQPFMRMMPVVLAAFRPEVKKKLIETGTLMPTIQMLFRSANAHLKSPKEYLTGKAHPSVFEGKWVDEIALVQKAHDLTLQSLPPMVQLRVLDDDKAINGIDFFDLAPSEVLAYTPACIARIHRGKAHKQRIVVDAGASYDLNKAKLTYTWAVLRGDADKITITPKKDDQSVVEIAVAHHERRPIAPGSPLESNRVDIGCFVHNGAHYSAPGFVTVLALDRESRAYDKQGKPLEIAHGMGEVEARVMNWQKMLAPLGKDTVAAKLFALSGDQQGVIAHLADVYAKRRQAIEEARKEVQAAESAAKNASAPTDKVAAQKKLDAARKQLAAAQKAEADLLDRKVDPLSNSLRGLFESRLAALTQDPLFTVTHAAWIKKSRSSADVARVQAAWQRLARLGIATNETLTPLRPGKTLADAKWTAFERSQLEWLHATLLAELAFPGAVQVSYRVNFVDHRLSVPREWRDIYRYDPKGECIGWTRYSAAGVQTFNHEGLLAVERDPQGRCVKCQFVTYTRDPLKGMGLNTNPLRLVPGDTVVRYEFGGKDDWRGKRAGTEKK